MLVDTDVLIWHLRGYPQATQRLNRLPNLTLSAITWLELLQGMRSRDEMLVCKRVSRSAMRRVCRSHQRSLNGRSP